jgi:hypothetical protein
MLWGVRLCHGDLQVLLRLNLAQLDDMQHGTTFPVVLLPADKGVAEDSAADPLLFFTHVTQPSRFRGVVYTPTLVGHIAALRVQLSETLVWRLYAFLQGVAASGSSGSSNASSSGGGSAGGLTAVGSTGRIAASGSKGRLVQAGSNTNLAAAGAGGGPAGGAAGGVGLGTTAAGDVQQVASADLPLQVRLASCMSNCQHDSVTCVTHSALLCLHSLVLWTGRGALCCVTATHTTNQTESPMLLGSQTHSCACIDNPYPLFCCTQHPAGGPAGVG